MQLVILITVVLMLSGCGQKGPLYLPDESPEVGLRLGTIAGPDFASPALTTGK